MTQPIQILIIEDDPDDLRLIKSAIVNSSAAAKLITFGNGRLAIDYLSGCLDPDLPDLIVLDYNMPLLNGAEVVSALNNEQRLSTIPKVILSTSNSPIYINESLKAGATAYLVKPSNLSELEGLAKKLLAFCD